MAVRIIVGDATEGLRSLPDASHQTCVTSPPYFGLRDYGVEGQIGLDDDPGAYLDRLVEVFREVRRVLRDDGTLWLNMGDSYAGSWGSQGRQGEGGALASRSVKQARSIVAHPRTQSRTGSTLHLAGIKPKDLMGMPWMLAFALRADGWWLRSSIVWAKPNPMPESIRDRPTSAHELVFLLSKRPRYFYDAEAIKEDALTEAWPGIGPQHAAERDRGEAYKPMRVPSGWDTEKGRHHGTVHKHGRRTSAPKGSFGGKGPASPDGHQSFRAVVAKRNARNVWTIATQPFTGAHFATMPPALVERCIKAGSRVGDLVLDPFGGAGTTGLVAIEQQRGATLIELNPDYADMARRRIGLFAEVA
jgi:DNA modification methylase